MNATVLLAVSAAPLDPAELTAGERVRFAALPGAYRRRRWLTGRRALRRGLAAAGRPPHTAARTFPDRTASLTHSGDLSVAAVAVAAAGVVGVGIDVERDRTPDPRTAGFYLTAPERAWLADTTDRAQAALRLWTVKEALFKADPGNAATVLRDYEVGDPSARRGTAHRVPSAGPALRYVSLALPTGAATVAVALAPARPGSELSPHDHDRRSTTVSTVDFPQVRDRISTLAAVPVERLTPDVTIAELVPDSFAFVEVAVDLQEEFDVVLTQHDLKNIHTLGDLTALLARKQRAEGEPA
ncbi:4'-phosphopantetheinyl transferase superfamily protein [Krasilnikovia sp. MM14-A1259]|uniref:4'-phosphopantetheinyl transferase superfamily protein n=1 Tax=Krasilnikovia sp. MM14-A1259 TaxID=3373539 RepID=UPI00382E1B1E